MVNNSGACEFFCRVSVMGFGVCEYLEFAMRDDWVSGGLYCFLLLMDADDPISFKFCWYFNVTYWSKFKLYLVQVSILIILVFLVYLCVLCVRSVCLG